MYLPNEPKIANYEQQVQLTNLYLEPIGDGLEALLLMMRRKVDEPLKQSQPLKLGKPYPLGQCLEISQAFLHHLSNLSADELQNDDLKAAYDALQKFTCSGGEFRQVWGDLRGQYFQNAFIMGSWYVDVANDTVNPDKPPVEILPFPESGLRPIQNFAHFAVIAKRYWKAVCLPNLIYPELAPFFPLIVLQPNAAPQLHGMFDYMIALTMESEFRLSEEALRELPFPEHIFQAITQRSDGINAARVSALKACERAREHGEHRSSNARQEAIRAALSANQTLQSLSVKFSG